ncbi:unnamed protein product [Phyllotreta striolata]|uniref:Ankyrin repeat protein n=1 Tax=Phyllotreta striolata TaxID=444603 RepID=A0A9N9TVW9_PHYSR|nr:unnamed protein product [Phyllotreta striolata]
MDALVVFWMLLGITIYLTIVTGIKMYKQLIYDKNRIIQDLCKSIEENDIVTCIDIVRKHPQYINSYNNDGYTPFMIACACGNNPLVTLMLNSGADVKLKSLQQESPFYLAAFYLVKNPHYKNATCIRQLYYAGADIDEPNAHGKTPLQMASMFGNKDLVKWLLLKNASIT